MSVATEPVASPAPAPAVDLSPQELLEARRTILATPAGYARGILGLKLYDWQADLLNTALETPGLTSARCCNEAGKTTNVAAPAVLYVLSVFRGSQVVVTSGAWRQVKHQLFPAIARHAPKLPGWSFNDTFVRTPWGSTCLGFSTDDAGLFEGFHVGPEGHRDTPLLIIFDEAKSIDESIFIAGDRCRPTWVFMMSSTGVCTGRFYQSHTSQRSLYRTRKIGWRQCPHIAEENYQRDVLKYGANHWFIQSAYEAEFSEDGAGGLVMTLRHVEDCLANPVAQRTGSRHGFCDFAAGRAENVFADRIGNVVEIVRAWADRNTMAAVGEFISLFLQRGYTPETAYLISGDADGLGGPMLDRLAELGWHLTRWHGNAPAGDKRVYGNRNAEVWANGAGKIARRHVHLPNDQQLIEQLTARMWKRVSDGSLLLESKEDMAKRGLPSPDKADAVLGCMEEPALGVVTPRNQLTPLEVLEQAEIELDGRDGAPRGWNAG